MNRISASRLLQIAHTLQVPAAFFFDGAQAFQGNGAGSQPLDELARFMSTRDGVALAKALMQIGNVQLRRRTVDLVEQIEQNQD